MPSPLDRILVVSGRADSCVAKLDLKAVIRAEKPEVRCCSTIAEVEQMVRGWTPRVILLDLVTADGSPEEWHADLRRMVPSVPAVLVVSEAQEEVANVLLRQGAADYVLEGHAGSSLLRRSLQAAADRAEEQRARQGVLEKALADRDRLLALAGRVGRIGGWTIDLARRSVEWSDEVCAIHEAPRGTTVTLEEGIEYFAPEHRTVIAEHVRACARDGTPYDLELQKITFRGRRIWVRTIGEAVRAPDGSITHIQGAFQDITEQRRAYELQLESEGRYRALFEQSLDGIVLLDGVGRIQAANGVVLITTKSGRVGRTEVSLSTQYGAAERIKEFEVLNAQEYAQNRLDAILNAQKDYPVVNGLWNSPDEELIALAKAEMNEKLDVFQRSGVSMAIGGALLMAALLTVLWAVNAAVTTLFAQFMEPAIAVWASPLVLARICSALMSLPHSSRCS